MKNELPRYTNEHLANERTFLAWLRTAIAIMAFGFVVVKFSLFVKQISLAFDQPVPSSPGQGFSGYIGTFLVALGGLILLIAYFQFRKIQKQINSNNYQSSSTLILLLTILIFGGSIALIAYLLASI